MVGRFKEHHLPRSQILIADDEPEVVEVLDTLLGSQRYVIHASSSVDGALAIQEEHLLDVALIDLSFSRTEPLNADGLHLLEKLRQRDPELPVIVITGYSSVANAIQAMKLGARDFVEKPFDGPRLRLAVQNLTDLRRARLERSDLLSRLRMDAGNVTPLLLGESITMQTLRNTIQRAAEVDVNVLITGEPGTGKEVVARNLHHGSKRAAKPFIAINMGGFSETLFESELFGHVRGAYTDARTDRAGRFELASKGTLFLDEVGNLPVTQQAKLLRALETRTIERVGSSKTIEIDVRLISATNADLNEMLDRGLFRDDLYFRLNTVEIHLPPLREHPQDIPILANYFLRQFAELHGRPTRELEEEAIDAMSRHRWRGNVRELRNLMERAVIFASGPRITFSDLRSGLQAVSVSNHINAPAVIPPPIRGGTAIPTLIEVERQAIQLALHQFEGDAVSAAKALGLSRSALYRRIQALGITKPSPL
jgi:DNA-binding NtrC family response regulator